MLEVWKLKNGSYVVAEYDEQTRQYKAPLIGFLKKNYKADFLYASNIEDLHVQVYSSLGRATKWLNQCSPSAHVLPMQRGMKYLNSLTHLRIQANLSPLDLAKKAGVELRIIVWLEEGKRDMGKVPLRIGLRLADALGVDAHELLK